MQSHSQNVCLCCVGMIDARVILGLVNTMIKDGINIIG
jgi:hypothetical protein